MSKQIVTVGKRRKYNKDSLTWVACKGWQGVVYIYRLDAPGDEKDGWVYVGCTPEEETRKNRWNKPKSKYAGKKIAAARRRYALINFKYTVVDTLYDRDIDKLVEKLEDREKDFIKMFDSFEHGFNSNKGGTGRKGTKISLEEKARRNMTRKDNGFHHTDAAKQKISAASKKRRKTQAEKNKISASNSGKKRTEEMKKAQSDRMKGIEPTAATEGAKKWRDKNGGGYWKGQKMSDEAKANMKAAQQRCVGVKVRAKFIDGTDMDFLTKSDAANHFGVSIAAIDYCIVHKAFSKKAQVWFEKI